MNRSHCYRALCLLATLQYFTQVNKRVFDLFLEDTLVANDLDIFVVAGGANKAFTVEATTICTDGAISFELVDETQNPIISAVEMIYKGGVSSPAPTQAPVPAPTQAPVPAPTQAPVPAPTLEPTVVADEPTSYAIRINVGDFEYTDSQGRVWMADDFTIGGSYGIDCSNNPIAGTLDGEIYCSNRWFAPWNSDNGPYIMEVPVEQSGEYTVRLHFAEIVSGIEKRLVICDLTCLEPLSHIRIPLYVVLL